MRFTRMLEHEDEQQRVAAVAEAATEIQYAATRVATSLYEAGDRRGVEALERLVETITRLRIADVEDPWAHRFLAEKEEEAGPERRSVRQKLAAAYRAARREMEGS